jgi:hypothetical protein
MAAPYDEVAGRTSGLKPGAGNRPPGLQTNPVFGVGATLTI